VFDTVDVVGRLGKESSIGMLVVTSASPLMGAAERAAIETALAPVTVHWIDALTDVIGTAPAMQSLPERFAVLSLGEPIIDGSVATLTTEVYCGPACAIGGTYELRRDVAGMWAVTGMTGMQWVS
jgi:hypothetical protein